MLPALVLLVLIELPAAGQVRPPVAATAGPLDGVCGGAWNETNEAIMSGRRLHGLETRQVREKVTCLLSAISTARFDRRGDDRWNDFLAAQEIKLLVAVYGPDGYDFFASQISQQPDRVRNALIGTLFEHGQPEAAAAYFASRRGLRETPEESRGQARGAVAWFGTVVERGECAEPVCSTRMNETLRIVSENLDIVESDLRRAAELTPPAGATETQIRDSDQQRQHASDLMHMVERIRRGDATLGRAQ